ncbi:PREDICTED: uncharacterized protein LOC109240232 [Nicotiana attenuata]|uniref:uncharacterized protein LOC109240232 n=1 Tax=Nicotiana attenuata TaxID=49451 RepID=UPI000904622B|nr:PREDICTED: uncharacterized protein LOC109240232 [Nicotiana attenuata]
MKKDIAEFVAQCPNYQQVKIEHQKPVRLCADAVWDTAPQKEKTLFQITEDGVLRYRGRIYVPNVAGLRQQVIGETHYYRYYIHPGATKMYRDIREVYWCDGMNKDIAVFVAQCPNYQQVKIEHQKPGGLLQAIEIPSWKWEGIMRFGRREKLIPRYIGPYRVMSKVGQVAYELDLPPDMESVHPVFHVSMLRKCIEDPSRIVSVDDVQVTEQLSYEETPIVILDRQVRRLGTKDIASVKNSGDDGWSTLGFLIFSHDGV